MNVLASLIAPAATGVAALAPMAARGLRALGDAAVGSGLGFRSLLAQAESTRDASTPAAQTAGGVEGSIREFHQRLLDRLLEEGIDPTEPIEISRSPFGDLVVVNAHSRLLDVERLLAETPALSNLFDQIARSVGASPAETGVIETDPSPEVDLIWESSGATARVH